MTDQPVSHPEQAPDIPVESATEAPPPRKAKTSKTSKTRRTPRIRRTPKAPKESKAPKARAATQATETKETSRTARMPDGGTVRTRVGSSWRAWRRVRDAIANAVVIVAVAAAIILAVHVVFVVFEANGANGIVKTINDWAETLAWKFKDVFTPANPKTAALVNYGLAAAIYLIVGRIVSGLIRKFG